MNTKSMISNELREMYGFLFHEVRELDRNCHSFCVVWSADGGFTRLSIDLMLDKWKEVLALLPPEVVMKWIDRCSDERADDELPDLPVD